MLGRAVRNGTATTADPAVRSDLRRLDRRHELLSWDRPPESPAVRTDAGTGARPRTPTPDVSGPDGTQRYALSVRNNGSPVTLTAASAFQVFNASVGGRVVAPFLLGVGVLVAGLVLVAVGLVGRYVAGSAARTDRTG